MKSIAYGAQSIALGHHSIVVAGACCVCGAPPSSPAWMTVGVLFRWASVQRGERDPYNAASIVMDRNAGGFESMSNAPYYLPGGRFGAWL